MNLGDIFFKAFFLIVFGNLAISIVIAFVVRLLARRCCPSNRVLSSTGLVAFLLWILSTAPLVTGLHEPLFVSWHKSQNKAIPDAPCLSYSPSFTRLYATFSMTLSEYENWASTHPWNLSKNAPAEIRDYDLEKFGITELESAHSSEMAENGKHLVTMYRDGIVYLAYYAN